MNYEDLQERVPPISDAMLVDFVSGITVNRDQIRYRSSRGALMRLWDSLTGTEVDRQQLIDRNLTENQQTLFEQTHWLVERQRVSDTALRITQGKLLETRTRVKRLIETVDGHGEQLGQLDQRLEALTVEVDGRLTLVEADVRRLKALDEIDATVEAWASRQTYGGIPWLFQLQLLALQISRRIGPLLLSEPQLRREALLRFVNKVSLYAPEDTVCVRDDVALQLTGFRDGDAEVVLSVLDPRQLNQQQNPTPLLFALGSALELHAVGAEAAQNDPERAVHAAIRLAEQTAPVQRVYGTRNYVSATFLEHLSDSFRRYGIPEVL